jgi:ATP synthase protein I
MSEGTPPDPLTRLGERIDKARRDRDGVSPDRASPPRSGLGLGFRISIELVAALCVGLALGWVFDRALGTRPWGLIVFFFLVAAAGMVNVFRAANEVGRDGPPPQSRDRH